ncbi:MAG: hypothetical protein V4696_07395 [Pseudomonadota bacterium]
MTPDTDTAAMVERLRELGEKAAQEADDVRYYGGPSGTYRPHRDALHREAVLAVPDLLATITRLTAELDAMRAERDGAIEWAAGVAEKEGDDPALNGMYRRACTAIAATIRKRRG